jgi:hypothetical protein
MSTIYGNKITTDGTAGNPFTSPSQAQANGTVAGTYYFKGGAMSAAQQLEYQPGYFNDKPFVRVFTSPYASTATVNKLDLNIPMQGLLVQRDTLDLRAAVYWITATTYSTTSGTTGIAADYGYSYLRVILGAAGGHGIFNNTQQNCSWSDSVGAIGAGWDGTTCGTFPNGLIWGTGQSGTATYTNRSGTWSHWVTWR